MGTLDCILAVVFLLWAAGCLVRRKWPVIPWPLWAGALLVALLGWFEIANAQASYDRDQFVFNPLKQLLPFAPGVVDRRDSIPIMLNASAMLGAICFAADLARRQVWRTRIWWTVALNGIAVMICGLGMKVFGIYINSSIVTGEIGWDSFAFFYYHGNAGAFINLILPMAGGLAAWAFMRLDTQTERAIWVPALLICVASSVVSVSKGGMAIAFCLLIALGVWFARVNSGRKIFTMSRLHWIILGIATVLLVGAMASLGWSGAASRWATLSSSSGKEASLQSRWLVTVACFRMMADSGFWGFGPGNFSICFPHYANDLGDAIAGQWYYAHDDYLQTIVEWGYVGAALLAAIFFGGIWSGFRRLRGLPMPEGDAVLLAVTLLALAGVAVHAAFDFPLQIASIQLYAATYLGICWAGASIETPPAPTIRRRRVPVPRPESASPQYPRFPRGFVYLMSRHRRSLVGYSPPSKKRQCSNSTSVWQAWETSAPGFTKTSPPTVSSSWSALGSSSP
jgi:O-antigen ligase